MFTRMISVARGVGAFVEQSFVDSLSDGFVALNDGSLRNAFTGAADAHARLGDWAATWEALETSSPPDTATATTQLPAAR